MNASEHYTYHCISQAQWATRTCYGFLKFLAMPLLFKTPSVFPIFIFLSFFVVVYQPWQLLSSFCLSFSNHLLWFFFPLQPVFVLVFLRQSGWSSSKNFCRLESSAGQKLGASSRSWSLELLVKQYVADHREGRWAECQHSWVQPTNSGLCKKLIATINKRGNGYRR